jgi:hypothetical protein
MGCTDNAFSMAALHTSAHTPGALRAMSAANCSGAEVAMTMLCLIHPWYNKYNCMEVLSSTPSYITRNEAMSAHAATANDARHSRVVQRGTQTVVDAALHKHPNLVAAAAPS